MATVGSIQEFDTSKPNLFELYADQIKYFLEANAITDEGRKRATLLAVCGIKTLSIIRTLVSPKNTSDFKYDELILLLKQHFCPKSSEIFRRFKFHKRVQSKHESVNSYVTDLRKLAEDCNFGDTLSERLRDQIVCGLYDDDVQKRLLAESKLILENAISIAVASEVAASQSKFMHSQQSSNSDNADSVDFVRGQSGKNSTRVGKQNVNTSGKNKAEFRNFKRDFVCFGCGGKHERSLCKFKDATCHSCGFKGHIKKVCRKKSNFKKQRTNEIEVQPEYVNCVRFNSPFKQNVIIDIEGEKLKMEVDSGSYYSIISEKTFRETFLFKMPKIQKTLIKLRDFSKNGISLAGICKVNVTYNSRNSKLNLLISKNHCTNILGYSWFEPLGISLTGVNEIKNGVIDRVIKEYSDVFDGKLGTYKGKEVSLPINPDFPPVRCKARSVPLAMKPKIEAALAKLLREGVIEEISNPKWSTPVVPVIKQSGEVRLCGDYKVTLNKAMSAHPYPIPAVKHLLSNLKGGGHYAKIDLAQAYLQLPVDEVSAEAQTIITHKGAFKVKRLQYGVNVAPGIFQNLIEYLFRNLEGVVPYFDDVLIRGNSEEQLAERLEQVLKRLHDAGLKANKDKCLFGVSEVDFLGYRIDAKGIHPSKSKVEAIHSFLVPKNKTQLQAFLGLINFYNSFLKDKATKAEVLHRLLDKESKWEWTEVHDDAFKSLKELLSSEAVLVPFDEKLPITLACDASPFGVGAVLSHVLEDGREAPVAFASRTLTPTERNYAQIDKEALAIVFGVKKFHHFLYGHKFKIITDHQPLLGIFAKSKPTKEIMSPRMLRWTLILNAYDYTLTHKPGRNISNADSLSRLPKKTSSFEVPAPLEVLFTEELQDPPLQSAEISKLTLRDPVLSRVLNWVLKGWPSEKPDAKFQIFFTKRNELSTHRNCLLWGNRVIIPSSGKSPVLQTLHLGHPGIERMKALARSYVWWPGIDADIENFVKHCFKCQQTRHAPPKAPVHPWEVPERPWSRLHVDFAGPFQGQEFLILVDAYSKWVEVRHMTSTSAGPTVDALREIFATHGVPDVIVSDNGGQFRSSEYQEFLERNLIRRVPIAPRRPSGNGQAERTVQTVKDSLRRIVHGSWRKRLARFLLQQHCTPSLVTGFSPAELLMGRRLRTVLDKLHPDLTAERKFKQEQDACKSNEFRSTRSFDVKDPVFVRNYGKGLKWSPATIVKPTGPVSYKALTTDGDIVRRHVDQMLPRVPTDGDADPGERSSSEATEPKLDPVQVQDSEPVESSLDSPINDSVVLNPPAPVISSRNLRPRHKITKPGRFKDFVPS